jgi:hypothetical protein
MPVKITKVRGKKCFRVSHSGKVSAKCTSEKKAKAQKRLLLGVSHGMQVK